MPFSIETLKICLLEAAGKRRQRELVESLLSCGVGAVRRDGPRCSPPWRCVRSERGLALDRRAVLMYLQLVGDRSAALLRGLLVLARPTVGLLALRGLVWQLPWPSERLRFARNSAVAWHARLLEQNTITECPSEHRLDDQRHHRVQIRRRAPNELVSQHLDERLVRQRHPVSVHESIPGAVPACTE
jgi:hypothetical protein